MRINDQTKLGLKFALVTPVMLGIGYLVSLPVMPDWHNKNLNVPKVICLGLGFLCSGTALACAICAVIQLCAGFCVWIGNLLWPNRDQKRGESDH